MSYTRVARGTCGTVVIPSPVFSTPVGGGGGGGTLITLKSKKRGWKNHFYSTCQRNGAYSVPCRAVVHVNYMHARTRLNGNGTERIGNAILQ